MSGQVFCGQDLYSAVFKGEVKCLPAGAPYILTDMRIGIGTAFIVVIVSEMIAVNNGLDFRILEAREYFIVFQERDPSHRNSG
jgi:hypothetical protein